MGSQDVLVHWLIKTVVNNHGNHGYNPLKTNERIPNKMMGPWKRWLRPFKYGHFYPFFVLLNLWGVIIMAPLYFFSRLFSKNSGFSRFQDSPKHPKKIPSFRSMICVFFFGAILKGNSHYTPPKFNMVHLKMMYFNFFVFGQDFLLFQRLFVHMNHPK